MSLDRDAPKKLKQVIQEWCSSEHICPHVIRATICSILPSAKPFDKGKRSLESGDICTGATNIQPVGVFGTNDTHSLWCD